METAADIIDALGGSVTLAKAADLPIGTVSAWKTRQSIPVEHWPKLVALAAESDVQGLTYDRLVLVHTRRPAPAVA